MNNPTLTRHARRRQQTRQRLIQAALELVLEKGYEAVNIQDITDKADLGRGTFYIHFKDKEDIIWSGVKDLILELEGQAHRQFEAQVPEPLEYYGLLNIFRHCAQNRDIYRVILGGKGSAVLLGRMQDLMASLFLYDIRQRRGEPKLQVSDEFLAQMFSGAITRLVSWWLETANEYTPEQMAAMTYQAIYHKPLP